jgi:hypothetical protein
MHRQPADGAFSGNEFLAFPWVNPVRQGHERDRVQV